ncbi:hypothetical protein ACJIZ3_018921 [Penstemon smallii]|uniref:Uncharacterized protein n=1 Tax=Penstemon smallii TaxID=265156 RepID=A0ABD3SZQ9_9LAMI
MKSIENFVGTMLDRLGLLAIYGRQKDRFLYFYGKSFHE